MASCEKCWRDSASIEGDHAERYGNLIEARRETPCSPEEQAGEFAAVCSACGRRAVHQYVKLCVACGKEAP